MQHKDIVDSELHEVKGAAGATDPQAALFATGSGSTTFRKITYADLDGAPSLTVGTGVAIEAVSLVNQTPTAADTDYKVTFGAASTTDLVDLSATGDITFLNPGTYIIEVILNCGRYSGSTAAFLYIIEKLNGTQIGEKLKRLRISGTETTSSSRPVMINTTINVAVNDVYTVNLVKSNTNGVGLIAGTMPVVSGWPTDVPSASLRILSFTGD